VSFGLLHVKIIRLSIISSVSCGSLNFGPLAYPIATILTTKFIFCKFGLVINIAEILLKFNSNHPINQIFF